MSTLAVRKKLSDEVRLKLEEMIRDEIYPLGATLPSERDLMELFGVGRPSIREALYALERMGLVKVSTGERAKVTRPTPDHFLSSLAGAARMLLGHPEGVANFEQARLFLEEDARAILLPMRQRSRSKQSTPRWRAMRPPSARLAPLLPPMSPSTAR